MQQVLPSELSGWALLVQRKVERYWQPPAGIRLDDDQNQAVV
jgi:hypothetical protein